MSQLASSRPALRSAMPRPLRTRPEPRPLRVVSRPPGDGRIGFVMFCLSLLIGGLMGLLMLNTSMATSAFELRELRVTSDELGDIEDYLSRKVDSLSAPGQLAKRAQSLGMVPAQAPAFLRLSDGKVLGVAEPAVPVKGFRVVVGGSAAANATDLAPPTMTTTRTVLAGPIKTTTVRTVALDGTVTVTITRVDTRNNATSTTRRVSGGPGSLGEGP